MRLNLERLLRIALCIVSLMGTARAQRHIKIAWLGNSYICDNGAGYHLDVVLERFINVAHDSGLTDVVLDSQEVSCLWAMGLAAHYGDLTALAMVQSGSFTHVVLQGYIITTDVPTMEATAASNLQFAVLLADEVKQAGAVPIMWCAHPRCDATPSMWDYTIAAYQQAADSSESEFAPVSIAWRRVLAEKPELGLYQGDCIHQNANGIYLNAAMFYCAFTGSSVVGNPVRSVGPTIPDTTALYLQQVAWAVYDSVVNGHVQPVHPRASAAAPSAGSTARVQMTSSGILFTVPGLSGGIVRMHALDGRVAKETPCRGAPRDQTEF
jgi:hypothetical protein